MRAVRRQTVGIKELKDQASSIVDSVSRTGQPVTVTKNKRQVVRIVPIARDRLADLVDAGIVSAHDPGESWRGLQLEALRLDAGIALQAIQGDRDDG